MEKGGWMPLVLWWLWVFAEGLPKFDDDFRHVSMVGFDLFLVPVVGAKIMITREGGVKRGFRR